MDPAFWADTDDEVALQRFRTLVNTVNDGIYQLDAAGRFVAVNAVIVEMSGYTRDELLGEHVSLLLADDDIDRIRRRIDACLPDGTQLDETFEFTTRTKNGESIFCELQTSLLVEDGSFEGTVGIVRNITDQKQREQSLQDQKRQLERERDLIHHILETSPIGIQVLDADGEITRMNDRLKEILEISTAEVDTYDPSDRSVYDETGEELTIDEHPFAHTLETGEPVYEKMMRVEVPSGDSRWLSVNAAPIFTDDGTIDCVVTTAEDITELKARERELSTELDEVFGRISDAFYALDEKFRFEHVNTQAEELLQHSEDQLLGKKLWDVFPSAAEIDEVWDAFHTALETQEATSYELYYDELDFWVEANIYPSETGVSVYFRDVTDRKEHEQELELFRTLLDHSSDSVLVIDPSTGQILDVNGTTCRRLGYDRDELLELSVPDVEWGLPDLSAWESHVEQVKTEGGATFDGRHERKDGSTFPVEVNVSYADLSQEYVIAVARDVTKRRQRERELEKSERRYRTLAECFPNGIVTLFDDDLTYTLAAGRAFDDLPLDPDEVEGNPVQDVWDADTVAALEPQLRAALDGEETAIELEYAGREWVVYVVPVSNDSGEIFAGMTMAQNITERKETERQLRHREHELEQYKEYTDDILDAIDDVFYVLDDNGTLRRWNATVSEVTGYASDDVVDAARVEQSRVTNAYKTLNAELGLPAQPVRPSEFIPRLASELNVPAYIRQRARRLAEQSESTGVASGVKPSGFAAACLYKAGCEEGRWLTQAEVAEAASVTPTTIQSHQGTLNELAV